MNYKQLTGKSIQQAFNEFDKTSPQIYEMFIRFFFELVRKGHKKVSAKLIINRIRWECVMNIPTETLFDSKGDEISYKLNDAFQSRYARKFISDYPNYESYFNFRELRDKDHNTAPITP